MCNIAGYVGEKNATPILIDMIRRQEGLNGGFFTGIATYDGAHLDFRKIQGELSALLEKTDAAALEGKMGIAHSRTPSGGDGSWAHPFTAEHGGEIRMCYVANGSAGTFNERRGKYNLIADALVAEGFDIPCKLNLPGDKYLRLATGETVHMSDVMCQLIYKYRQKGKSPADAMSAAFCEMPSEIVGLVLDSDFTDRIFFSRINMPMFVGFDGQGAYLASSPTAFPDEVKKWELLPPLCSGIVYRDHVETFAYPSFSHEVVPYSESTVKSTEKMILSMLCAGDCGAGDMFREFKRRSPEGALKQAASNVYAALYRLIAEKKVEEYPSRREKDGISAPKTMFRLIKAE